MHRDQLRDLLRAKPFQPFTIHLPEGRQVQVIHHDFALMSPDGRTLLAYGPDNSFNMIDVMLIASIHVGPPAPTPKSPETNGPPSG
jgi:hypothetical protein